MDLLSELNKQGNNYYANRPLGNLHEFYLTGDIKEAEHYTEWFDHIRRAQQTDIVKVYINSFGGDLFTAIQFMRVMGESQATVICSVEGACMSAATMIFLCADAFEISEHSMFMFHNYSGGAFGKGGEMIDQLNHEREWSEKLLTGVYEDFLTKKEIDSILDNKDIWMDGDEVVNRLEKKAKKVKRSNKNGEG